jgi:pimeloyl-ACP methyl ester carboxylesterase
VATAIPRDEAAVIDISIQTPPHLEHRVDGPDGRVLAVAEWGDPNGLPVFFLHGTPGGRIGYWNDPDIYARFGIRRLTYDRPGYGESTRKAGRVVADAVPDVIAIADALEIGRFAVTGGSGGGPHSLACAALLPDRVLRCQAVVSVAPYGLPDLDWLGGQTEGNVQEFRAAAEGEAAIRALTEKERDGLLERFGTGDDNVFGDNYELSEADRLQMARHRARIVDQLRNGLAHGVDGWVDDDIAFTKPWGFDVESIRQPVYLAYGRTDNLVPPAHGDWLAAHIPNPQVHVNEEAGHMGDDATIERELRWLATGSSEAG